MKTLVLTAVFVAATFDVVSAQVPTSLPAVTAKENAKEKAAPASIPTVAAPGKDAAKKVTPKEDTKTPSGQSWWQALIYDVVFKAVLPIFATVLSALLFLLLRKWGFKVQLDTLDSIAEKAALYAEHRGAAWLKEHGEKSGGAKKEDWAWELVEALDEKVHGRTAARDKLRGLILAKIPKAEAVMRESSDVVKKEGDA